MEYNRAMNLLDQQTHEYHLLSVSVSEPLTQMADMFRIYMEDYGGDDVVVWEALIEVSVHTWLSDTPDQLLRDDLITVYDNYLSAGADFLETFIAGGYLLFEGLTQAFKDLVPHLRARGLQLHRGYPAPPHNDYSYMYVVIECIDPNFPEFPQLLEQGYLSTCRWLISPTTSNLPTRPFNRSFTPGSWT